MGGRVKLDPSLAASAIRRVIAEPLGLSVEQAALGIIRVVNVNMEAGIRLSLAERGLDPRQFALVAFGGAGPAHAARVARNVGIPRVVVPPHPGISCAMGLLQTDVVHHYLRSRLAPLAALSVNEIDRLFGELRSRALAEASAEGFTSDQVALHYQMDLRYPYQGYELTVDGGAPPWSEGDKETVRRAFDRLHERVYGIAAPEEVPEVVNLRIMAVIAVPHLSLADLPVGGASPAAALKGSRRALFEAEYVDTPVYDRSRLLMGNVIEGSAIIEQFDSTTVVLPGQQAGVGRLGVVVVTEED